MPDLEARNYKTAVRGVTTHYFKPRSKWSLCRHVLLRNTHRTGIYAKWRLYAQCKTCESMRRAQGLQKPKERTP